jgi:hypothetical protein
MITHAYSDLGGNSRVCKSRVERNSNKQNIPSVAAGLDAVENKNVCMKFFYAYTGRTSPITGRWIPSAVDISSSYMQTKTKTNI